MIPDITARMAAFYGLRITELTPDDPAYPSGARYALRWDEPYRKDDGTEGNLYGKFRTVEEIDQLLDSFDHRGAPVHPGRFA